MSYHVLVNGNPAPGGPYPTKAAAEYALAKRKAHDQRVAPPIVYKYELAGSGK